jgi:hypothetical protein
MLPDAGWDIMLEEGLEPSRGCPHRILNPARLPVPPPEPVVGVLRPGQHGAEGSRTPDLLNAIQALSQLSYGPSRTAPAPGSGRHLRPFNQPLSGADETRTRDLRCDRPAL